MPRVQTKTGGREATHGVIPGRWAVSVGKPSLPAPSGFRWVALTDLARLESGHTPSRRVPDYWGGDIPWIGIRDATEHHGLVLRDTAQHVTDQGIANSSARVLPAGTVCLSRTASVGYVVMMGRPMATSQDFVNWVCGPDLEPHYLKYILLAEQESIRRFAHGTTHQTMYYPEAKALHVCVPDVEHQRRALAVLKGLDDLIDSDARLLTNLDQMLMATWTASSQASSPGSLGDYATLLKGVSYQGAFLGDSGLPLIGLGNFGLDGSFRNEGSKRYQGAVRADRIMRRRDLVVANTDLTQTRDILARPLLVPFEAATSTHHTFQVKVPAGEAMTAWLYCALRVEPVRRSLIAYSTGTTVAALPADALASLCVPIPDPAVLTRWWSTASLLLDTQEHLNVEREQAKATRDELLPLLISGRISPSAVAS